MLAFTVRRLFSLLVVIWGAVTLVFYLYYALPGDPAEIMAGGNNRNPDPAVVANIGAKYGLDDPIIVQYGRYMWGVVTWDFGESFKDGKPVTDIIAERTPASLRLATWAMALEASLGIFLGVLSAKRKGSLADSATTIGAAVVSAIPVFVLAFLFQQVTGVYANTHDWPGWARLPVQGIGPNQWYLFIIPSVEQFRYLIQPAIVLATVSTVVVARLQRTTMLETQKSDFVRTARAKGLSEGQITRRHTLRNALIPVVTFIGIDFGTLITAAILTETVFNWPGLGSRLVTALDGRDLPVLVGLTTVVVLIYGLVNLAVDLSYGWLDPRVRQSSRGAS